MSGRDVATSPRTARLDVAARERARVFALLPAAALQLVYQGMPLLLGMALAVGSALLIDLLALKLRGGTPRDSIREPWALGTALLFCLLLAPGTPLWTVAPAMLVAVAVAGHAFGGAAQALFNPAMTALALVALLHPQSTTALPPWPVALAYGAGGAWLLWLGAIRWQAPLALLAATLLAWLFATEDPPSVVVAQAALLAAAALFAVTERAGRCATLRGHALWAAGAGLLWVLLQRWHAAVPALAFALLMMNCAAPWIDGLLDQPRRTSALSGHDA